MNKTSHVILHAALANPNLTTPHVKTPQSIIPLPQKVLLLGSDNDI